MAKQLNVDLSFRANTKQAQQAIMELQSSLSKIALNSIDDSKMKSAAEAAKELSIHLNNAYNAKTGNFDLSKLDRSLKTSSSNITELSTKLLNAGAAGEQAFVKLAKTIAAADRPVVTLNSKLNEMFTTLKNTARWQLSSSILHGFMGAVQQAYGYAQDLNKSLNDIRIVTGQNTDQMSRFAEEANRAAKNLSTTTTAYTKAALIYYQQGDKGSTITEKGDVTTKMANVTGQSTEVVSQQLTAIWNNFNKSGDQAYEHYADVLTALGAATASSTDEIAGGLEKFAGIAETIGLSYEYAASALATITATSRESEDVVGTALKTIFSRIQGLNLGETLDDGTTLNKYSEALAKVGISIKDQSGQLKEMDIILDEMGAKWKTLNSDQQMALAQAVAGTRQYNQMMTLMNNWDFMQENVNTAKNSKGELQKQQDIYAESWEAANKRVQASMQAIYADLIDDEFFIDLSNGFASLLDSVDAFIDGIGGVKTIIMGVASFFLSSVANKITPALQNLKHSFTVVFQTAAKQAQSLSKEMNETIDKTLDSEVGKNFSVTSKTELENARSMNEARAKMQVLESQLTDTEKQRYNQELNIIALQQEETNKIAERIDKLKEEKNAILDKASIETLNASGSKAHSAASKEIDSYVKEYREDMLTAGGEDDEAIQRTIDAYKEARSAAVDYQTTQENLVDVTSKINDSFRSFGDSLNILDFSNLDQLDPVGEEMQKIDQQVNKVSNTIIGEFGNALQEIGTNLNNSKDAISSNEAVFVSFVDQLDLVIASMPKVVRESDKMSKAWEKLMSVKTGDVEGLAEAFDDINAALAETNIEAKDLPKILKEINPKMYAELIANAESYKRTQDDLKSKQEAVNRAVEQFNPKHAVTGIEAITKTAAGLGQVAMAASSARAMFQAWANDDMSFGEKLITTLTSISMIIPSVMGGLNSLNTVFGFTAALQQGLAMATEAAASQNYNFVASMEAEALAKEMNISKDVAQLAIAKAKALVLRDEIDGSKEKLLAMGAEEMAKKLGISTEMTAIIMDKLAAETEEELTKEKWEQILAEAGLTTAKGAGTLATIAQTVATWALNAAMSPLLLIILLITAAIAALALIGMGLVAAFNAIKNASPEGQLENAKVATEAAAKAAEEANSAYSDLLSTISKYDGAVAGLENLTKGTEEYRDKILEANAAARELIDTYGLTNFDVGEGGLIELDKTELAAKKGEYQERVEDTSSALTGAQKAENDAEDRITKRDLTNEIFKDSTHYSSDGYKDNYLISQSNIDKVLAAANESEGGLDALLAGGSKAIAEAMGGEAMGWDPETLNSYQQDFINSLIENSEALHAANDALLANAEANEAATKAQLAQNLANDEAFVNSEYQNELIEAAMNNQDQAASKAKEDIKGMTQNEMYDEYAKLMGYTNNGIGTWLDGKQEFLDAGGNKVELTPEQVKAQLAEMYAQQNMETNALDLVEVMETVMARANTNKGVVSTALSGSAENLTIGQSTMTAAEASTLVTEEEAKALGFFEGAAAFGESFANATKSFATDWQTAMGEYVTSVSTQMQSLFDSGALDNLTMDQSKALADTMQKAYATSGQEGITALSDMFTQAGDYSDEFATALGSIDWETATPDALQDALEQAGVKTAFTAEQLNNLIYVMNQGAIGFEAASEKFKTLSDIVDTLKDGGTISAKEFESLGPGMDEYFMRMADGTYALIGDAEQFYALVKQQQIEGFQNTIAAKNEDNKTIQNVLTTGVENLSNTAQIDAAGNLTAVGKTQANAQVDFLEQTGYDPAQVQQWRDEIAAGKLDVDALTSAVETHTVALGGAAAAETLLTDTMAANADEIAASEQAIASTATTIAELNEVSGLLAQGKDSEAYQMQLDNIVRSGMNAATTIEELNRVWLEGQAAGATATAEEYAVAVRRVAEESVNAASSISELQTAWSEALNTGVELDFNIYADALLNLAAEYDHCADEAKAFNNAMSSQNEKLIEATKEALELSLELSETAEKFDLDAEATANFADRLAKNNAGLKEGEKLTAKQKRAYQDMAIASQRLDRGLKGVNENLDDYKKALKTADRNSMEFSETMDDLKTNLADIFNVADGNMFSDKFAEDLLTSEEYASDFEKALDGDVEALDRLRAAATMDIGQNIIDNFKSSIDTTSAEMVARAADAENAWNYIKGVLEGGFTIGDLNDESFINSMNEMIKASGMTKDQIQSMLGSMGVSAKINTAYEEQEIQVPTYLERSQVVDWDTYDMPKSDGSGETIEVKAPVIKRSSTPGPVETHKGFVAVHSIETTSGDTTSGGTIDTFTESKPSSVSPSSTTSGVKPGGGGGGGGSTKKTSESRKKRSDMGERYKEITDKIEDQTRAAEKASRAMDRLYGTGRIRAMRQLSKELEKEVELLKQKREEAENYLKEDARELESAAGALGYTIRYDQGENISNYTAIMDQLYKDREKLLDSFGNEIDETEQEALDALDESIERFESAVSTYDETKGILKDLVDEIDSKVDEQMSLAADELSYRLELRLEVDDRALTRIEYLLSRMEDDFFQMGEQAALLAGEKYSATVSKLQNYQTSKDEWDAKLAAREVTPERYAEAMQEIYDGIYTELGALEEIDNAMKHYYEDTVAAAGEEIAKYTDRMSRAADVLEHYKSVLTLIGKSTDYKKMGAILDGQTQTIKNSMAAAKTIADMYYEQAKEKELLYKQALAEGNEEVAARYKLEWEAALGAAEEASDEYQGLVEQWAENVNAILENTLAGLKQDLEKTITGGSSFDDMLTAMDRAESLQEEYLTTTNKIYETNKLMRKAQQDIDKSTNSIAKKRLKQFITETQELQNQTKLSNYELEIQQAKYNLLLAEIAVEEARNAKSTVRLQRDNEGNFGYVYTADTSAVDAAVQQYEDAQNRLYNLSLEGANEYSRKYLQTLQEMSDAFSEIEQKRMEGHYATNEEYQQVMDAAKKYYYEKLENYSYLYSVALGTDANVAQEAWSTEFGTMTTKTEEWKTAVNSYVKDAGQAFKDWKTEMDAVESAAGIEGDLDALKTKVGEVTTESGLLLDELTGEDGLLAAIKQEFIDVSNATTAWDTQYTTLKNVRNEYDLLGQSIKNTLDEMSKVPDEDDVPNDEIDSNDGKDKPDDTTPDQELKIESQENVPTTPSYLTGNLTWKGNGANRVWTDSAGNTYKWNSEVGKAIQAAFNTAVGRNGGYTGDFFLGWNTLSADELQKYGLKDVTTAAFDTGGYTGSWGSYGKLAILHEKELILKPQDTENFLASMDLLNKIVSTIDLYTINAQLGGALNSPYLGMLNNTDTLEQSVHIEANFPSVTNHLEIEEALSNLVNTASQFANRK